MFLSNPNIKSWRYLLSIKQLQWLILRTILLGVHITCGYMDSLIIFLSIFPGSTCSLDWRDDALDRDLYIQTSTVTILAMDGRRRWLDIDLLVSADNSIPLGMSF